VSLRQHLWVEDKEFPRLFLSKYNKIYISKKARDRRSKILAKLGISWKEFLILLRSKIEDGETQTYRDLNGDGKMYKAEFQMGKYKYIVVFINEDRLILLHLHAKRLWVLNENTKCTS